ncbi:hypothetical protein SAMN05216574_105213 [Blastococcus tunisiensis]|uniref:Uncharacterized protein n=1 Tax=Blastococcus tunisiensis TaxID=1798228 RepID=A0A1I2CYX9_9ACTN|nr:hypothetical protein SAMN05216574_105213 [Blastococcus sp. DSM 46838]
MTKDPLLPTLRRLRAGSLEGAVRRRLGVGS